MYPEPSPVTRDHEHDGLALLDVNCLTIYLSNLYHVVIMRVPGSCCLLNYCYEPSFTLVISDPCMNTRFAFLGGDFYEQFKCNKLPRQAGPDTRLGTLNISRITPGVVISRPLVSPGRGCVIISGKQTHRTIDTVAFRFSEFFTLKYTSKYNAGDFF